jgi:segregation and condensation protein B
MTSGFTDDAGVGATNDEVAGGSGAVDGAIGDDAIVQGSVRDDALDGAADDAAADDGLVEDGALDDGLVDDGALDGVIDGGAVDDGAVDGDAIDAAVHHGTVDDGAQPVDVNAGDDADIEELDGPGVRASLEAILLVADEPVPEVLLAQVLERPRGEIDAALRALAAEYTADGRGFDLREIAGGWRFYTREDCAPLVERFVRDGQEVRLTQAALETLAVIAYRQPVSRARVSAVRGVNCDGVIRTLVLRGLVEDSGTDQETGAILYRTTGYFLERLGMASLDELPDLAPFLPENIEDIEDNERTRA